MTEHTHVWTVKHVDGEERAVCACGWSAPASRTASELLDRAAVAELLGVEPATISSYVSRGQMPEPDLRFGGAPVWRRETIEAWRKQRRGQGWRRAT